MVRDISEKPASGEKSPSETSRKNKRKAKPKSAAIATRKPRSGRSRAAKSPKAPVTDAASAGAKPAKSQASIASTHTAAGSTTNTPGSTTGNTAVGENAPHDTAPIAGAKDPGMQYQNMQNQNSETPKSPISQQSAATVAAKVPENGSVEAVTDDTVLPATPKTSWTPVLPQTHDVGDSSLPPEEEPDPMKKMLVYAGAALALIVFLIFVASLQNMKKYFVVERGNAVEVWKGRFSPLGRERLAVLTGVNPPAEKKEAYTRRDVFPMLFSHYIEKADAGMEAAGSPDFSKIKSILTQAGAYVTSAEERALITDRLKIIDRTILLYRADVAAEKGTIADLKTAKAHLGRAAALQPDAVLATFIQQKIETIEERIASLKAGPAAEKSPQAPPTETPPPAPKSDDPNTPESAPAARGTT